MSEKGGNLVSSVVLDKHIMGGGDSPLVPKVESRFKTSKDFAHHPLMVPLQDFSINGLEESGHHSPLHESMFIKVERILK